MEVNRLRLEADSLVDRGIVQGDLVEVRDEDDSGDQLKDPGENVQTQEESCPSQGGEIHKLGSEEVTCKGWAEGPPSFSFLLFLVFPVLQVEVGGLVSHLAGVEVQRVALQADSVTGSTVLGAVCLAFFLPDSVEDSPLDSSLCPA